MTANIGWLWMFDDRKSHFFKNGKSICGLWEMIGKHKYYSKPTNVVCRECKELMK